jgi:hypothetical protein
MMLPLAHAATLHTIGVSRQAALDNVTRTTTEERQFLLFTVIV